MARRLSSLLLPLIVLAAWGCAGGPGFRPAPGRAVLRLSPPVPPPGNPPPDLLIVSYNIQFGEDVAVAIADLEAAGLAAPDVLLLQEMTPAGVDSVAAALGLSYVYQPAAIHSHHGRLFGEAVLSRWPITAHRLLVLPHAQFWTGRRRIALACDLDVAGRPVRAVSLHLATVAMSASHRLDQAAAVVDSLVAGWEGPLVVGGDFNSAGHGDIRSIREYYRRRGGLTQVRLGDRCTVRWSPWQRLGPRCDLDHIFLRGLDPESGGVATDAAASDHYPVWTRARWRGASGRGPGRGTR